jgi:hypothetical protein
MKKKMISALVLCAVLLTLLPAAALPAGAANAVTDVSTVAEFKTALENNAGAHVRLQADITFTAANAADSDFGVILGTGYYTIDLNGRKIEYNYTGYSGDPNGAPLATHYAKSLTVNGPGDVVGGSYAVEQSNQFGVLTVNGGTLRGVMNSGIRMTGGIAYINGGTVTGNFYGVFHEDGIVVLNGGTVKSVVYRNMGQTAQKYGVIENGIFTGNANLEDIVLIVDSLTISAGSGIRVTRGGGLVVNRALITNGTFTYESGLKSIGGMASISSDAQVHINRDVTFQTLEIRAHGQLTIENGATVTVTGSFVNDGGGLNAKAGSLVLLGSIDHRGHSEGVPELEELEGGGVPGPDPRDFSSETAAAERLKALGLFQGVGTNPDGSTTFDLARSPSRVEALVMLIRLLGKEDAALNGAFTHPFTDVPEWADKYVGYAYTNQLTNGVSASKFGTGDASCTMVLTFVLRALGFSDAEGVDFTWDQPEPLALSAGILPEGVHAESFLRADVALVSEAALSAKLKNSGDSLLDRLISEGAVMQIPKLTVVGDWPCGEAALQEAFLNYYPLYVRYLGEPTDFVQSGLIWKWDERVTADMVGYDASDNSIQMGPLDQHREALERGDYSLLYLQMMHETAHLFMQYDNKNVDFSFGQWIWEGSALIAEYLTTRNEGDFLSNTIVETYDLHSALGWDQLNGVLSDGLKVERSIVDRNATAALAILTDVLSYDSDFDLVRRVYDAIKEEMNLQGSARITAEAYGRILDAAARGRLIDGMKPSAWLFSQPVANTEGKTGAFLNAVPFRPVFDLQEPIDILVTPFRRVLDSHGDLAEELLSGISVNVSLFDSKNEPVASRDVFVQQDNTLVSFSDLTLAPGAYKIQAQATVDGSLVFSVNYFLAVDPERKNALNAGDRLVFITTDEQGCLVEDASVTVSGSTDILSGNGYAAVRVAVGKSVSFEGRTYSKPVSMRIIPLAVN